MPVFEYIPANPDTETDAHFEFADKSEAGIAAAKLALGNIVAFQDITALSISLPQPSDKIISQLQNTQTRIKTVEAAVDQMPYDLIMHYWSPEDEDITLIDQNQQSIYPYGDSFSVNGDTVDLKAIKHATEDAEVARLVGLDGYNYYATTIDPTKPEKFWDYTPHDSLGYISQDVVYAPMVTILSPEHPLRNGSLNYVKSEDRVTN